jgi:hypothetical protein
MCELLCQTVINVIGFIVPLEPIKRLELEHDRA